MKGVTSSEGACDERSDGARFLSSHGIGIVGGVARLAVSKTMPVKDSLPVRLLSRDSAVSVVCRLAIAQSMVCPYLLSSMSKIGPSLAIPRESEKG